MMKRREREKGGWEGVSGRVCGGEEERRKGERGERRRGGEGEERRERERGRGGIGKPRQ